MAPEIAQEKEKEVALVEVSKADLARYGWKMVSRRDTHTFMILVVQGVDIGKALADGKGFFARHQVLEADGKEIHGYTHVDQLRIEELSGGYIMSTRYNPSIGHSDYTILEKRTE